MRTSLVFGLLLIAADRWAAKRRGLAEITWPDAMGVGCAQALAVINGRSFVGAPGVRPFHGVGVVVRGVRPGHPSGDATPRTQPGGLSSLAVPVSHIRSTSSIATYETP